MSCWIALALLVFPSSFSLAQSAAAPSAEPAAVRRTITVNPAQVWAEWQGWGSSLSWWAHAVGGSGNANTFADLLYTIGDVTVGDNTYPGLGLTIVRYNVGGGGVDRTEERKSSKMPAFRDIHGFWTEPPSAISPHGTWDWTLDPDQRAIMQMARQRGAETFELFSNAPMWWMTTDRSSDGSVSGGDCLAGAHYDDFATYLATVAKHARDDWRITFVSVEPFNEPSADWWKYPIRQEGCHFDPRTQQVIIGKLRSALDAAGLHDMPIAGSDENDADVALRTWNGFDPGTRARIGRVNVHGYRAGTYVYRGTNMPVLRDAAAGKPLWMSEYGDGDSSGTTLAQTIIFDIRGLHPRAWVYWQPVEPQRSGWGLLNADYVDTSDKPKPSTVTPITQVNRKYFVFGQFARYIRPGMRIVNIDDTNSIAAYDEKAHKLVIVVQTGAVAGEVQFDLSRFARTGTRYTQITTSTAVHRGDADRKLAAEAPVKMAPGTKSISISLYPDAVETIVIDGAYR
jgi:galactan endo-1,6-beta-galactosidase